MEQHEPGNERAKEFEAVFERLSDALFRHALLRLSDRERAVELAQECFLRGWEYLSRGEVIEDYRPFLYRVLNNLIIDEYRRRKPVSLDAMLENEETREAIEGKLLADEMAALEEALIRFEAKRALAALVHLPDTYREVLILRYVDSFSITEIAEQRKETSNAISVRIHRGLQKLRSLLEKDEKR